MSPKYICIKVIFILIFVTKIHIRCDYTTPSEPTDEDYEDYTGEISDEITEPSKSQNELGHNSTPNNIISSSLSSTSSSLSTTPNTVRTPTPTPLPEKCPIECVCEDNMRLIDCSNRGLQQIPPAIPLRAIKIDLSSNQLTQLNVSVLQNHQELRALILFNNKIEKINENKFFEKLHHLTYIDLSSNRLSLSGHEFSLLPNLSNLTLANNENLYEFYNMGELIMAKNLEALNISNCGINQLNVDSFASLEKLQSLDLRNNSVLLTGNIVRPLKELRSLQLSNIENDTIEDVCKEFASLDIIKLPEYDLSCFSIMSGDTIEQSIFRPIETTTSDYMDQDYIFGDDEPENSQPINTRKPITVKETASVEAKPVDSGQQVNRISQNTTTEVNSTIKEHEKEDEVSRVNISSQSLNIILISIMVITLFGILVGIICRIDCCGIKTKLCRTRRRQTPTDQVRPAEEVPLNKL